VHQVVDDADKPEVVREGQAGYRAERVQHHGRPFAQVPQHIRADEGQFDEARRAATGIEHLGTRRHQHVHRVPQRQFTRQVLKEHPGTASTAGLTDISMGVDDDLHVRYPLVCIQLWARMSRPWGRTR
jgi:hypothetical protein